MEGSTDVIICGKIAFQNREGMGEDQPNGHFPNPFDVICLLSIAMSTQNPRAKNTLKRKPIP